MIGLPDFEDTPGWAKLREETPVLFDVLTDPGLSFSCQRCNHSVITPVEGHVEDHIYEGKELKAVQVGAAGLHKPRPIFAVVAKSS